MPPNYHDKVKQLRAKGIVVTEPSPALYDQFRKIAVENVHPSWAKRAGGASGKAVAEIGASR